MHSNSVADSAALGRSDAAGALGMTWPLIGATFFALLAWTCVHLYTHVWDQESYSHGPIIVAIIAWLVWRQTPPALPATLPARDLMIGWVLLGAGLAVYVIGRNLRMPLIDVSALIPIAVGLLLAVGGMAALRRYWFPVLFLFFLVPLPQFVLDMLTGPLKGKVSYLTEFLLYHAGYPISRTGVILAIGQYQLLVADACSGLNSMFSLSAMGLLYLYLVRHANRLRNIVLLLAILPIAMFANLVRVIALVLITYHGGDEMGQGFLHGAAGMFLFVIALLCLFALDAVLGKLPRFRSAPAPEASR